jgi:hypothetical protein
MFPIFDHASEISRSHDGRFKWTQISGGFMCQFFLCFFLLISVGALKASDPGQLVWKEQRGSMKSAEIGVVVWKEQPFHNDAVSRAFVFERMKQAGPVTWFYNKAVSKSFEQHQWFKQMRFPQWPVGEIVHQEDFESLKFKLGELEAFAQKYPNASGFLEGIIGSMSDAVSKFSSGNVFFNGNWIGRDEYQRLSQLRDETLKRNAEERELYEKQLYQEAQDALKAQQEALKAQQEAKQTSQWILTSSGVWLLLLLLAMLIRSWGTVSVLVIALLGVAGWFTYSGSGFGWAEHVERAVKDLPSLLTFLKQ